MSEATDTQTGVAWTVIVQLTALPAWLALPREHRRQIIAEQVDPLLASHPEVSTTWVDVEAFYARSSDVLIARTRSLPAWNHLFEGLRDTSLFAVPYFRLDDILTGVVDGYLQYEATLASTERP